MVWCVDDRHRWPCPLPCKACEATDGEGCDPASRVTADSAINAMHCAGWDKAYIDSIEKVYFAVEGVIYR